ncbi:Crp/Fnr family transcriptional regulator [Larkinella sp. GY13]|uniref:Crp/Fnr family transcriptional regulator n=1 Tax=Larkinella sp. GY13 TaxID=3453720 RepID=UPI003EF00DFB
MLISGLPLKDASTTRCGRVRGKATMQTYGLPFGHPLTLVKNGWVWSKIAYIAAVFRQTNAKPMREKLVRYFSDLLPLSGDEATAIADSAVVRDYPKGTVLLREGQFSADTYFVLAGLVRQYSLVDGDEKTLGFFGADQWVISLNTTAEVKPAVQYWVCEEDSTLVVGNDESARELFQKHPRLETVARMVLERTFQDYQQAMIAHVLATPEQRYLRLLETRPDLIRRIPQYQLASYIGVAPESLSRIRKRLSNRR